MSGNSSKYLNVFLWHAPDDSKTVDQIRDRLKKVPWVKIVVGNDNLTIGQERTRSIRLAIYQADVVILFLSTSSTTTTGYIQRDLRMVMDRDLDMPEGVIFIIPLRLDDCTLPYDLDKRVHLDYFPAKQRKSVYGKLLKSLKVAAESMDVKVSEGSPKQRKKIPARHLKSDQKIAISKETTHGGHPIYIMGKMEFVKIPAGTFVMGSNIMNPQAYPDERPQLTQLIPYDYYIGRHPVTIAQYLKFVEWEQYEHEWVDDLVIKQNHPVTCITWKAAIDFCKWVNSLHAKDLPNDLMFRLPLEVEWEKAARGEKGLEWPWGDEFDSRRCNSREDGKLGTTAVGEYSSKGGDSPFGVADMAGNVWEWTTTQYRKYPYESMDGRESLYGGKACVVRGGSFNDSSKYARSAYRYMNPEPILYYFQGFRVVVGPSIRAVISKYPPHPLL